MSLRLSANRACPVSKILFFKNRVPIDTSIQGVCKNSDIIYYLLCIYA